MFKNRQRNLVNVADSWR